MNEEGWALVQAEVERLDWRPVTVWAVESDGRLTPVATTAATGEPDSDTVLPLTVGDAFVGHLQLPDGIDPAAVATVAAAARIAIAVDHARLVDAERRARLGAEHARRHVALLRESGAVLGAPIDNPDDVIAGIVRIVVPSFADWCAVDVPDGDTVRRLAWDVSPAVDRAVVTAALDAHPGWPAAVSRTIAVGRSHLTKVVATEPRTPGFEDHLAAAAELGIDSCVIVPVRLRGLTMGAVTLGTVRPRRGFRPSDVAAAEEVASRAATAVERALLFRESRERADQAGLRAAQLRRLTEAALAVHARRTLDEVLGVATEQARRVIQARASTALLGEQTAVSWGSRADEATVAELIDRARAVAAGPTPAVITTWANGWLGAPLTDGAGRMVGALVMAAKDDGTDYTPDDESILVSLAYLTSVALESAGRNERAQASEARVRALLEASPLGIVELAPGGIVRQANDAARRLLSTAAGRRFPVLESAAGPHDDLTALPLLLDREMVLRAGDRLVDLSISTARIPGEGDDRGRILVVIADITERKRLEDEVAKNRRMEAVGRMAGGVAHDFNNLLTVVLGHSHLLLRTIPADDAARAHVDAIKVAGERAANLSAQLLTISKGHMVQPVLLDLDDVLSSMDAVLRRLLPPEVEFTLGAAAGGAPILADHGQLEQLFLNLVVNARDAMPHGGRLTVTTARTDRHVVLEVADTGEGMTAEVRERCFEPFFSTRRRTSAGLGLATVYGIVTQAGGRISVASAPGAGTTFTLEFPLANGDVSSRLSTATGASPSGHEHVLLVEDDAAVRTLTQEMLQQDGYIVTVASGAAEALAAARSNAPIDLVITDVLMPDLDGVELAAQLERIRGPLPTLFVSGFIEDSLERPEGLPDGAAFLPKPFGPGQLVDMVRQVLADRRRRTAARQGSR